MRNPEDDENMTIVEILEDAVRFGHATKDESGRYTLTPEGEKLMKRCEEAAKRGIPLPAKYRPTNPIPES